VPYSSLWTSLLRSELVAGLGQLASTVDSIVEPRVVDFLELWGLWLAFKRQAAGDGAASVVLLYMEAGVGLCSSQRGSPCTFLPFNDCLHQLHGAGRGRVSGAFARGGTCACCPPARGLASSAAINFRLAKTPSLVFQTLQAQTQSERIESLPLSLPKGPAFQDRRATADPSTSVAAATFAQDDRFRDIDRHCCPDRPCRGPKPILIRQDDSPRYGKNDTGEIL